MQMDITREQAAYPSHIGQVTPPDVPAFTGSTLDISKSDSSRNTEHNHLSRSIVTTIYRHCSGCAVVSGDP
jgi:hypothetical protein